METFKSLKIDQKNPKSSVFCLQLNRPIHRNALSRDFFTEFPEVLSSLDQDPNVNVIVLTGDRGRVREHLRREIKWLQDAITAIERCRKPVIASIHGGIDIVTACDIRCCSKDAFFSVKEVDLAITADLGTLQRLPGIVGYGNAIELALTGRSFSGTEAKQPGLVSRLFDSKEELNNGVRLIVEGIGLKTPLAVTGTKAVLQRSRELSVEQGLDCVATWNSAMLLSDDLTEAVAAFAQKRKPVFVTCFVVLYRVPSYDCAYDCTRR